MDIIVSGSLAYDRIMDFQGYFADHIIPEKIHLINISFTVNDMRENFGGTAGNIAYALSMLGERPVLLATIGHDYGRYFEWLTKHDIATDTIKIIEDQFTATAYITTDLADNQITGFNPGAMKYRSSFDFTRAKADDCIMIIAPGNLDDMKHYSQDCKQRNIDYIFDPGQSLPMWNEEDLIRCIEGSHILISNDYELELIMEKVNKDRKALLQLTDNIITTLGEGGSRVCTPECETIIPAVIPNEVVDPTGAGDAYRSGLIKGMVLGKSIEQCAMMGSVTASFAIESYGTQEYRFTMDDFNRRLESCSS
jgi:adenosine kinase